MGKVYQEVNIGEMRRHAYDSEVEVLKRILSRIPVDMMPCIAAERDEYETVEGVPEFFMDKRIIYANISRYGRVIMINPELCGVGKVRYFDLYQTDYYVISIGNIKNSIAFLQCMDRLDGKTPQEKATNAAVAAGKKAWGFAKDQVWPRAKKGFIAAAKDIIEKSE